MQYFRFFVYILVVVNFSLFASNNYDEKAQNYAQIDIHGQGTVFLSFRDIPELLSQYFPMPKNKIFSLDYGCGAGRSTRFLKFLGIEKVDSVDIHQAMLNEAKHVDAEGNYQFIESGHIPVLAETYDLAFSSFVFVEIGDEKEIVQIFKDIYRVLKPGGIFIIVTPSEEAFNPAHQWLSYQTYATHSDFESGQLIEFKIKEINLELADYYWTDADFKKWSEQAGFVQVVKHRPLGKVSDEINWASEWHVSPYTIYIFQK
jgi:ubiquinone/menaquinone biosynthesis C-methylase UbiE